MRCPAFVLAFALAAVVPAHGLAQEPAAGAFLFAYQPHPGQEAAFAEGYQAHLDWHRERQDSLSWIGWTVLAGPRLGAFVDGVFGIRFASLDARVDPAGDAADLAENVTAHGDPVDRRLVRLRPELSTATPLEEDVPTPLAQVTRYTVSPGLLADVEAALQELRREAASGGESFLPFTVYEVDAGSEPGFMVMTWRRRLGSFDQVARDPIRALGRHLREAAVATGAPSVVESVTSEVWQLRPDLTYIPEE